MKKYIGIIVSFANKEEAEKITKALLKKKLIACSKISNINSFYWWHGNIENSDEVITLLETREDKFDEIEKIVKTMHSYDQPVMFSIPMVKMISGMSDWIDENLN